MDDLAYGLRSEIQSMAESTPDESKSAKRMQKKLLEDGKGRCSNDTNISSVEASLQPWARAEGRLEKNIWFNMQVTMLAKTAGICTKFQKQGWACLQRELMNKSLFYYVCEPPLNQQAWLAKSD